VVFDILDSAGLLVLIVVAVTVGLLVRRMLLHRSGASLACALRVESSRSGRGWRLGVARYTPSHVQWFRLFSAAAGPKFTFARRGFDVVARRRPRAFELHAIPYGAVVASCRAVTAAGETLEFELAMSEAALTGFLAWLESAPPGAHQAHDAGRR